MSACSLSCIPRVLVASAYSAHVMLRPTRHAGTCGERGNDVTLSPPRQAIQTIHSLSEIPSFQDEDAERAFWSTHQVSDELAAAAEPIPDSELPPARRLSRLTTIRFDEGMILRLKAAATARRTRYQTLLKKWVAERLDHEERHPRPRARKPTPLRPPSHGSVTKTT